MSLTAISFLCVYLGSMLWAVVKKPEAALYMYVFLAFLHPPSTWWGADLGGIRWSLTTAAIALVATLLHRDAMTNLTLKKYSFYLPLFAFIGWLVMGHLWALSKTEQTYLIVLYTKYAAVLYIFSSCIKKEEHLSQILWVIVLGAFLLSLRTYFNYNSGRFEDFGSVVFDESNTAALGFAVTVFFIVSLLFISSPPKKIILFLILVFIVNAFVATASRSGFLCLLAGGIIFVIYSPKKYKRKIIALACLSAVMLIFLSNAVFWSRINTISYFGASGVTEKGPGHVKHIDTGSSRVAIIKFQWARFLDSPLGTGFRSTAILSPYYLPRNLLTRTKDGDYRRSSHNTLLSFVVDFGIPGGVFFLYYIAWYMGCVRNLKKMNDKKNISFAAVITPALAASFVALEVSGLFINYVKLELRFWLIAIMCAALKISSRTQEHAGHEK